MELADYGLNAPNTTDTDDHNGLLKEQQPQQQQQQHHRLAKEHDFMEQNQTMSMAPEYGLREPNSFIMNLMEPPVMTTPTFSMKDAPTPPPLDLHSSNGDNNFMSLNGDYLTPTHASGGVAVSESVPQFPTLSLLTETSVVGLEEDEDAIMYEHCNSRRVLPHKKRISRKLKAEEEKFTDAALALQQPKMPDNGVQQQEQQHHNSALNVLPHYVFNCEICGHGTSLQLEFFDHLKQHYEPITTTTPTSATPTIASNETAISLAQTTAHVDCNMIKNSGDDGEEVGVFPDVELNFSDYQHNNNNHRHHAPDTVIVGDSQVSDEDMKILNSNSIDKCINYVTQAVNSPLKSLVVDEFSDTEDMLEGIRNVVDKVSIEDTCDAHDLMDAHDMRTTWFSSNNYSDIAFKSKSFEDVSLAQILVDSEDKTSNPAVVVGENLVDAMPDSPPVVLNLQTASDIRDLTGPQLDEVDLAKDLNAMYPMEEHADDANLVEPRLGRSASLNASNKLKQQTAAEVDDEDTVAYEEDHGEFVVPSNNKPIKGKVARKSQKKQLKKQYICTKCNREFNSGNALKYHRRTHLNLRPHRCDICERSFFAISALKSHLLIHANDKPFECEHCHRKFRQYADLNYHIVSIHTTIKSFVCEFCGKAFSRKYSLMLHVTIHTSVRNYKCDICSKTFRASIYLMNHRKIHTGEKPHECPVCGKAFRMNSDMRRHLGIHERTKDTPAGRRQKKTNATNEMKAES